MLDTKKMIQDGFKKSTIALIVNKDSNGKEHFVGVDSIENANKYKSSGTIVRLLTVFYEEGANE